MLRDCVVKNTGHSYYVWHACIDCGKERWVLLRNGIPDSLRCRRCEIRRRPAPDRKSDGHGYVLVRLTPETEFFRPMAAKNSNYVLEHRLVMAQHLKRCLLPWEVVHHRNGITSDNSSENLQLLPSRSRHMPDSTAKRYINKLEKLVEKQSRYIQKLKSQIGGEEYGD